jgi:hypothetical protein
MIPKTGRRIIIEKSLTILKGGPLLPYCDTVKIDLKNALA